MRKSIVLLYMLGSLFVQAQTVKPYDLIPYRKNALWGFADPFKNIVIQPQYDEIRFFKDEITAVRKDNKWGFIDKTGKLLVPLRYELAGDFAEGMCQVKLGNLTGYINDRGKEAIIPQYQFCAEFSEGLAVVSDSIRGQLISKVIDKTGKVILSNLATSSDQFHAGYLAVRDGDKNYFIDKAGKKLALPATASLYFEFADSMAFVKIIEMKKNVAGIDSTFYLGLIDRNGKLITDGVKDVFGFKVSVNARQGVAANFLNGFAIFQRSSASYADKSKEYAFIDKTGKMSMWYSSVRAFSTDGRSVVVATGDSTARVIDTKFKMMPASVIMADAGTFSEGLLRVKFPQSGKWGYINEQGEVLIYPLFDSCTDFSGGVALVTINGKTGFINRSGVQFWEE